MRFSNLSINLLLACCYYTTPHLVQAEPIVIDASKPFTKTINDEIVCEKVVKLHKMIQKTSDIKDGVYGIESFACVVAPEYTPSGDTPGITLNMPDVDETFEEAFASAQATGHTELVVKNPLVHRSTLKLPSSSQEKDGSTSSFSGSMFYSQVVEPDSDEDDASKVGGGVRRRATALTRQDHMYYSPHVKWRRPSNVDGSVQRGRKLAVNQTGTRSVVVFRATVGGKDPISSDAATISENVFGTVPIDPNMITLSSQFSACSNAKLEFEAGAFGGFTFPASGVVEVTVPASDVPSASTDQAKDISNAIYTQFGTNMDQIDHKMFVVPPDTNDGGSITWVAFASFPGDDGWYRDNWILDVNTLIHETGHNLGLAHSGEDNDEYADNTCNMGSTLGVDDLAICFNGAKSVELGWYNDRVATISPHAGDEFSGRLIGVNDYAISSSSDTLVVEIKNSDSSVNSLFVMYNKAEGINAGTPEAVDKVIITQGAAGGQSWKLAEITPGESWIEENYVFGKTLSVSTSAEASNGDVQYVTTIIELVDPMPSQVPSISLQPSISLIPTVTGPQCGNNICELECGSCSGDCSATTDCGSLESSASLLSYADALFGQAFDVDVLKDIYFHELQARFFTDSTVTFNVQVYTKGGSYADSSNLNNWNLVFDGTFTETTSAIIDLPFTEIQQSLKDTVRSFYITFDTGSISVFENNAALPVSNDDIRMGETSPRYQASGSTMGSVVNFSGVANPRFLGTIKYGYLPAPSDAPSDLPSLSIAPSDSPSDLPSSFPSELPSMQPSDIPSDVPSDFPSDEPSDIPSDTPSDVPSDVPSNVPSDSPSDVPSDVPSDAPSFVPSSVPSDIPSDVPSDVPSGIPSFIPSDMPSSLPSLSNQPSATESDPPSAVPSSMPSDQPSLNPSTSAQPSLSFQPSSNSDKPSLSPSSVPSQTPSDTPSSVPSDIPSGVPSSIPSSMPSNTPSLSPSDSPSSVPSLSSLSPSELPSFMPSISPSSLPSFVPSNVPSLLEPSSSPSSLPSMQPSKSNKPSAKPSASPSSKPSAKPSVSPSSKPSAKPSAKPSINQGDTCKDSGVKFKKKINAEEYRKRSCAWLLRKPEKTLSRCESGNKRIKSHCPNTCGACEEYKCADSEKKWFLWGGESEKKPRKRDCKWVGMDPEKIVMRCNKNGVAATCRATCKYTNSTLGLSC